MSRKAWISVFAVMAAMVIVMVAGTHFLYRKDSRTFKPVDERYGLAYAVPANAVAVFFFSEAENISSPVFSAFEFPKKLSDFLQSDKAEGLAGNRMAMSLHYTGGLTPIYVFDAGAPSDSASAGVRNLMQFVRENGFKAEYVNCSKLAPSSPLASNSLLLVAKTDSQIRISKRHITDGSSFMDADGFRDAAANAPEDVMFLPYDHARVLFEKTVSRNFFTERYGKEASSDYSRMASFFSTFADWGIIDLSGHDAFPILQHYSVASDFIDVLNHDSPSVSHVSEVLPYNTRFVLTLPMGNSSSYISEYESYLETVRRRGVVTQWQEDLRKTTKLKPVDFVKRLGVSEVATASFNAGGNMESVNLVRIDHADTLLLRGTGMADFVQTPSVMPYAFPEFIASVFGSFFKLVDESFFTLIDGWVITGSREAVAEYVENGALNYNLRTYMADAGQSDLMGSKVASCVAYMDIPGYDRLFADVMRSEVAQLHDTLKSVAEYSPVVMSVFRTGDEMHTDITAYHLAMQRLRPEKFAKETTVEVPEGPFKVINSGTGRTNIFYQQANGAIALKEEDGKGIWGVPFKKSLCGYAHNVDYYDNGNLQILFGAGSSIYIIDRRGAFVSGFPKDLGKEILVGPGLFDAGPDGKTVLMVLHMDNTLEMYDINGKKPEGWNGIAAPETVRGIPEMITLGDSNFWVVRTSIQTLIYPFYGGQPLTGFKGDQMILPTSEVKVTGSDAVGFKCYDGKTRTFRLK